MKSIRVITATDLHQLKNLYQDLGRAVLKLEPDLLLLVGDFLNSDAALANTISEEECAAALSKSPCEVAFVRGNHEGENWWMFSHAWESTGRPLHAVNGAFAFGPLVAIGFPSLLGNDQPYLNDRERLSPEMSDWMPDIIADFGPASRTLWLMHEPPAGTRLSRRDGGPISGHQVWRQAIKNYCPKVVVSGHDHGSPIQTGVWQDKIGDTTCINLGQRAEGPLRCLLIELGFPESSPCLPSTCKLSPLL